MITAELQKASWSSLELTKLVFETLTPLSICVLGLWAMESADTRATMESESMYLRTFAERQQSRDIEVTRTFVERLRHAESCRHGNALLLLASMVSPKGAELYRAICKTDPASSQARPAPVDIARTRETEELIRQLQGSARGVVRDRLASELVLDERLVGGKLAEALTENPGNYQIELGVLVALAKTPKKWTRTGPLESAVSALSSSRNAKDQTFMEWLVKANGNAK